MKTAILSATLGVAMAMACGTAALAESFNIQMAGQHRGVVRGQRFAIPTYHVNFVTSQQATSVMSIGSRARLAMVLQGVDQATMRRLTNEAYADLRTQMEGAGLSLVSAEETRAMTQAAGIRELPDNLEVAGIGPGVTIGSSIRRGWVTMGPDAAPALQPLATMRGAANSLAQISAISALNGLNRTPDSADLVFIAPSLQLDFVRMEAARGGMFGGAASTSGQVGFGVLASSRVAAQKPAGRMNVGTPGGFAPRADAFTSTPFAEIVTGAAAVRAGAGLSDTVDENYQAVARARGDAVVVNLPVWEGLVRDAYRSYNAAIVQALVSQQ
ncbi:hypothetical protein ASG17_02835 [Brevundimonas sp. Leaf363]|uniref:hypothetical protein n=1 Tax=Brevundimonas sp. Leaf363 TaxID=1736353 RepID=UPI0007006CC1|nr:hypothetical protein [Brevundimonas sp. Leaf363]KQS57659.1 hypothetical protein ASG17_02835 [Brevundimonas sp. Leaf363]